MDGTLLHNSEVVVEYAITQSPQKDVQASVINRFLIKKKTNKVYKGFPEIFAKLKHSEIGNEDFYR